MLILLTFLVSIAVLSTAGLTKPFSFTLDQDTSGTSKKDICGPILEEINLVVGLNQIINESKSVENGKYK